VTYPKPRNDIIGRFGGRDYRATQVLPDGTVKLIHDGAEPPADSRFTRYGTADAWVLTVPATECEALAQVSTVARYRQYEVQVEDIAEDGTASLYYLGTVGGKSGPPEGFERVGQWEFRTRVPVGELHDYHEKHVDLLAVGGRR
jgi:hypothetical protein